MAARRAGLVAVAGTLLFLAAPAASAATTVARQAWAPAGPVPTFMADEQHLYIAATASTEQARTFIELEGNAAADADAGAELVFVEADDGMRTDSARMVACALAEPVRDDGQLADAPDVDCRLQVPVTRAPAGQWRVPLGIFASRWIDGGPIGVALVPELLGTADTWRVSLDTARTTVEVAPVSSDGGVEQRPTDTSSRDKGEAAPMPSGAPTAPAVPAIDPPGVEPPPGAEPPPGVEPPPGTEPGAVDANSALTPAAVPAIVARSASHPSVVPALALIALAGMGLAAWLARGKPRSVGAPAASGANVRGLTAIGAGVLVLVALASLGELALYKLGLVLIVMVGAIGLHILVNWAGELSLAHAAFVGAPAFVVAKLAADHDVSPVYLLPVGIAVGAVLGALVGLPSLRAKGLQVALVTLAAYTAIDRFLFTKEWFVGPPGGYDIPTPRLGPAELTTTRSLYALLIGCVTLAWLAAWLLWRSKIARALLWARAMPDAAAVFGIPVSAYKVAAYALAGGFGGFAGALTVVWVQRLTPGAFPFQLSITYLIIVVIAGRGFIGGVAVIAAGLEGGRLFLVSAGPILAYGGPIALIVTLIQHKKGINGLGRQIMEKLSDKLPAPGPADRAHATAVPPWGLAAGLVAIGSGFVAIAFAWYHAGNTNQLSIQNQELISGGVGGLALVVVGVGLLIRHQLAQGQSRLAATLAELLANRDNLVRDGNGDEAVANGPDRDHGRSFPANGRDARRQPLHAPGRT